MPDKKKTLSEMEESFFIGILNNFLPAIEDINQKVFLNTRQTNW